MILSLVVIASEVIQSSEEVYLFSSKKKILYFDGEKGRYGLIPR